MDRLLERRRVPAIRTRSSRRPGSRRARTTRPSSSRVCFKRSSTSRRISISAAIPAATDESDGAGGSVRYGRAEEDLPMRATALIAPVPEAACMSLSRWNRQLGIYAYSSTTIEGVATDVWTLCAVTFGESTRRARSRPCTAARWSCRPTPSSSSVTSHRAGERVIVDGSALDAATAYHVRGIRPRAARHRQYVDVQQLDRNKIDPTALLLDGASSPTAPTFSPESVRERD
jgi:hypothetical protein